MVSEQAVILLLQPTVAQAFHRWRLIYDPEGASQLPPHIPLVAFTSEDQASAAIEAVRSVAASHTPFGLEIDSVAAQARLIYFRGTFGADKVNALRHSLEQALRGQGIAVESIAFVGVPIANVTDPVTFERALDDFHQRQLHYITLVESMAIAVRSSDNTWQITQSFPIGNRQEAN